MYLLHFGMFAWIIRDHGEIDHTDKLFFFLFPLLSVEWVISLDKVGYIWFYFLFLNLNFWS